MDLHEEVQVEAALHRSKYFSQNFAGGSAFTVANAAIQPLPAPVRRAVHRKSLLRQSSHFFCRQAGGLNSKAGH